MAAFDMKGCLQGLARANSRNFAGWAEGDVIQGKGVRQVVLENKTAVCYAVGADDIIITKDDIATFECVTQNMPKHYNNQNLMCNCYAVTLKNGGTGTFTILAGKAAEFTLIVKP